MVLKVCRGCNKKQEIRRGLALCRKCRKTTVETSDGIEITPLLWRGSKHLKVRKHKVIP